MLLDSVVFLIFSVSITKLIKIRSNLYYNACVVCEYKKGIGETSPILHSSAELDWYGSGSIPC